MKKRYMKITCVLLLLGMLVGITISPTSAQETAPFSISAVIPENQIDTRNTYFDLRMTPNQKQTIQVKIVNTGDQAIIAQSKINAASTGTNGIIEYNIPGIKDESMLYSMEDIAKIEQEEIRIDANSTAFVDILLTMPAESYDGVILGGILVTAHYENETENAEAEPGQKVQIENKVSYVLGLKLSETEVDVSPNMELHGIYPTTIAMRTAMAITLQNTEAIIMKNVTINAALYKKGSDTILHEASKTNADIAPHSSFDFTVDWENQKIEPGAYRLKMRIDYGEHYWEWDEEFEITSTDTTKANEEAINVKSSIPMWVYFLIIILLFLLLYWFMKRRRRNV